MEPQLFPSQQFQSLLNDEWEARLRANPLLIVELRRKAQQVLGERFDIRQFHDIILLGGALPLTVLEQVVEEYIHS